MQELAAQILSLVKGMWRRRWHGVVVAWIIAAIGASVLWRTPDRYEATARVYVDTKTVLKPLMRDLAVEPDIDLTVTMLARTLITRPNIDMLLRQSGREEASATGSDRVQVLDRLMRDIKVSGAGRDNVFDFSFRDSEPEAARRFVQGLVSLFVESGSAAKLRDSEKARGFIDDQIKGYEARLIEAENRLKDFKLRNIGILDGPGRDYFTRISALTDELNKLSTELRAAEQSRDALRHELEGERASLLPDSAVGQNLPVLTPELDARLEGQRRQLDDLLRRFTELHPDVVSTRKLIARLEEQKQQQVDEEAKRRAAAAKNARPTGAPAPNQQIRLALAESEGLVASLRVRSGEMQGRLTQLRSSANRVPQVEAELAQLNRDYEVIRRNYEALVSRREQASISEDIDATRPSNFRVIEPPRASQAPVFPNRLVLVPVVLILALGGGVLASFVSTQLAPTVDDLRSLRVMSRRPVLGSVSRVQDSSSPTRLWPGRLAFGSALGGLVASFGVWIGWMLLLARN